ncbi:MAG: Asp23/Gls24 family envelope stress response protein [Anaerolineae bacterium]
MNVFNRIIMLILIIAMIAGGVYLLLRPMDVLNLIAGGIKVLQDQIYDARFFMFFAIGGGIFLFILLLIFWLEIKRVHFRIARVQTKGKNNTWLGIQSIAQSLEYRIDELSGVRSVKPKVTSYGKDVEIYIALDASPTVSIVALTDQVTQMVSEVIETQLGLKIRGKVLIQVSQEPYPRLPASGGILPDESKPTVTPRPNTDNQPSDSAG